MSEVVKVNRVVVGVADMYVSESPEDRIVTFSLGSCVGVTLYDPELGIGGMIHCMLPSARMDMQKAEDRPCMFVDSGLKLILQQMFDMGVSRKRLIIKLAGAASVLNDNQFFKVGERNYIYAKRFFEKNMLPVAAESVHGTASRTLSLYMDTGITTVRILDKEEVL
ncbi:MAG: chemotaxis protein CheD [Victivallales bacterium]|nr:chemotaxis protein CheD [Victivallales bacterium]